MNRSLASFTLAVLLSATLQAATINTTLTVTATGSLTGTSITVTGPATLTGGIGNGTFSGTLLLTSANAADYTITLTSGDKINGKITIPATALAGGPVTGASATVTGGTGAYAGATGSFPSLTGSGTLNTTNFSISLTFTGDGQIITGGGGGGPTGPPAPTITSVQNNYGLISPGLPNYGLAPSTLFFITGTGLANSTTDLISSASPGLPTTLNGVTVSVTAGGKTTPCPLYYLSATQIDAVLPGGTPVGNATITVTNNGATSAAFTIPVVQSAFGILGYNGSLAAAYDGNNNLITATNAANPNQVIALWGSGVGADPNDDDKLYPQKQDDLTTIPMQAFIGGVPATIAYRGRSGFPGLDQVVLTVPATAPTGCYVSLAIVSGNMVSNSVTIPIAASGKTCSDSGTALGSDTLTNLSGKTTIKEGVVGVSQTTTITAAGTNTTNSVFGSFQSVSGFAASAGANQVSLGSCVVYNSLSSGTTASTGTVVGLDAGASISVTGPAGSLSLTPLTLLGTALAGFYGPPGGTTPASFLPTGGGAFTFDNGSGGKDVQHFNVTITLPAAFTWANASQVGPVTRGAGSDGNMDRRRGRDVRLDYRKLHRDHQCQASDRHVQLPGAAQRRTVHGAPVGAAGIAFRQRVTGSRGFHQYAIVHGFGSGPGRGVWRKSDVEVAVV